MIDDLDEFCLIDYYGRILSCTELNGPNFIDTPKRVARAWKDFLNQPKPTLTTFPLEASTLGGMIVLKNHETWGFCPHHLLPVKYTFKIGYIPEQTVLGLSKLARIAEYVIRDLPIQEDVASRIVLTLKDAVEPKGIGVIIRGEHLCMKIRGVESPCAEAISTVMWGIFLTDNKAREEFMLL